MKIYTALDITMMGDYNDQFGQTFYGGVEEQDHPIRFNLKTQANIMPGRKIFAEESEEKKSGKGNPYTQLRKVKLSDDTTPIPFTEEQEEIVPEDPVRKITQSHATPAVVTPDYEPATNARWAIGMAYRAYQQVMGTPEDGRGDFPFGVVKLHAQNLVQMFREMVYGGSEEIKDDAPQSGYDKAKAARAKLNPEDGDPEEDD